MAAFDSAELLSLLFLGELLSLNFRSNRVKNSILVGTIRPGPTCSYILPHVLPLPPRPYSSALSELDNAKGDSEEQSSPKGSHLDLGCQLFKAGIISSRSNQIKQYNLRVFVSS